LADGTVLEGTAEGTFLMVLNEIVHKNEYTPPELPIGPEDVVVDIGANVGVFAVMAAKRTRGPVLAFEPFPENFRYLERNARANGLTHLRAFRQAVADQVGTTRLYVGDMAGGNSLIDHNIKGRLEDFIEVPVTTLRAICEDHGLERIDFLKVDCEGAEGMIFRSVEPETLARIGRIAIEFHDNVSPLGHGEIEGILQKAGFRTRVVWDSSSPFGYLYAWR